MIVQVTGDGIDVVRADDLNDLRVRTSLGADSVNSVLRSFGSGFVDDSGVAHLYLTWLHQRASAVCTDLEWEGRWLRMVAYSERRGWRSADGLTVSAHIDRAPTTGRSRS